MDARAKRRRAYWRGHASEFAAAGAMLVRGYVILARRFKTPVGEIDLIARRGQRLAFVEVKQRPTLALCKDALTRSTQQRVRRAADFWLARNQRYQNLEQGFDAVFLVPWRLPAYMPNVF